MNRRTLSSFIIACCIFHFFPCTSFGETRYSSFLSSVTGNSKTLGMAGAMTGLADNYSGALDNPAGPAMTLESPEFTVAYAGIKNPLLSSSSAPLSYSEIGASFRTSWGLGLTLSDSFQYKAISPAGEELSVHGYHLTLSKRLLENRLSIGFGTALASLSTQGQSLYPLQWSMGVLYRLPYQLFMGASYHFANTSSRDSQDRVFTQPGRMSFGISWMPNRFFKTALKIQSIESEERTFLFHLPQEKVGIRSAFQYHLGASYQFISLKGLDGFVHAGTYREDTRTSLGSRQHYTWGVDVLPLFLQISVANDIAPHYRNTLFNVLINFSYFFKNSPLYPPQIKGPSGGLLPNPFHRSEDWMMSHIQDHPEDSFQPIEPEARDFGSPIQKNKAIEGDLNFFQRLFQIFRDE